ncbi:hypothetical protein B0F90DRAFT_316664 [Multifurca ochricompacta]|uniref:Uncharacterized protein n=1 Tax=Multifurca ochricompacta TaxID=376703 RepID=A0AAD4M6M5_9AGAM|nr:hypothetical protein B0F90DRAFT_316664 [Multifurca ochricompacta]
MAASNSTALAEILGIPSTSSSTASPSPLTITKTVSPSIFSGLITSTTATASEAEDHLQKLTTATQSVGDYFKAKLDAKARPRLGKVATVTVTAMQDVYEDDGNDLPRAGLGVSRSGLSETWVEPVRGGIGASSPFAATFVLGQATVDMKIEQEHEAPPNT